MSCLSWQAARQEWGWHLLTGRYKCCPHHLNVQHSILIELISVTWTQHNLKRPHFSRVLILCVADLELLGIKKRASFRNHIEAVHGPNTMSMYAQVISISAVHVCLQIDMRSHILSLTRMITLNWVCKSTSVNRVSRDYKSALFQFAYRQ